MRREPPEAIGSEVSPPEASVWTGRDIVMPELRGHGRLVPFGPTQALGGFRMAEPLPEMSQRLFEALSSYKYPWAWTGSVRPQTRCAARVASDSMAMSPVAVTGSRTKGQQQGPEPEVGISAATDGIAEHMASRCQAFTGH